MHQYVLANECLGVVGLVILDVFALATWEAAHTTPDHGLIFAHAGVGGMQSDGNTPSSPAYVYITNAVRETS